VWVWGLPKESEMLHDFDFQSKIRRFCTNTTWFNAFDMTDKRMTKFADFLKGYKPNIIIGYVSALYEYARFMLENNITINPPKAICITAEPSTAFQRELIEKAFGTKTFNEYGSSEILRVAAECCERQGLHIHADSRYVEITDAHGSHKQKGEIGNIVITDLENRAMPLIRYRNDDLGSIHTNDCACHLNLPLMENIMGRIYDMITLRDGKKIYGHMFSRTIFRYVSQIKQFQVHQIALDKIIVRIVPDKMGDLERLKCKILSDFQQYTSDQINYSFEIVKSLKKERSGKLRYVKSDV